MKTTPRNPFLCQYKENKDTSRVNIGAYVPEKIFNDISANALYSGMSRSALIESAMQIYLKNQGRSELDLITRLSKRALAEWDSFRAISMGKAGWAEKEEFANYRTMILKTLRKRGLNEELIKKIMERLRQ